MRRKRAEYFKVEKNVPDPVVARVTHRISFSEVDVMAVAWHGRYPQFFELALEELCRSIGLSYKDYFDANLGAPIVQLHLDYHSPVVLDEEITIIAKLIWNEAARLNTEYTVMKEDGAIAATGYTVQMFVDIKTGEPALAAPKLLEKCLERWKKGEFKNLE